MGVSYNDFWKMNPRILKAFANAYELKYKETDRTAWLFGRYVYEATAAAVDNNLRGRKSHAKYRDRAYSMDEEYQARIANEQKVLTEEEKRKKTEQLFLRLRIMQGNFNIHRMEQGGGA